MEETDVCRFWFEEKSKGCVCFSRCVCGDGCYFLRFFLEDFYIRYPLEINSFKMLMMRCIKVFIALTELYVYEQKLHANEIDSSNSCEKQNEDLKF